jgi:hypothetical protein
VAGEPTGSYGIGRGLGLLTLAILTGMMYSENVGTRETELLAGWFGWPIGAVAVDSGLPTCR